jgi:hypothetical protein
LACCLVVALAVGAGVAAGLRTLYPDAFPAPTDIVGLPAFTNFNVRLYQVNYILLAVVFPAVTTAVYIALTWVWERRFWPAGTNAPLLPGVVRSLPEIPAVDSTPLVEAARAAFVGSVLSIGVAVAADDSTRWLSRVALPTLVIYVGLVALVGWATTRARGLPIARSMAGVNAAASPLVLLVLVAVSRSTEVTVSATGAVDRWDWLPTAPTVAVAVVAVVAVVVALGRLDPERWPSLERWMLLLVVGPVTVFLLTSALPNSLGAFDFYHEGEVLTASHLITSEGAFPWRDLLFIHGLTYDVVGGWVSGTIFENTRWGMNAGFDVVLDPVYWVGGYFLCVYLFRRNWVLLVASQLVVILGMFSWAHFRFVFHPFLLLLLAALLRKSTWTRATAVVVLAVVQFIASPEASFFSFGVLAVVVLYELSQFERGTSLWTAFSRTGRCLAVGAVVVGGWVAYLTAYEALGPFVDYYRTFSRDHDLTGGMPIARGDWDYEFWAVTPVVLILLAWAYVVIRMRTRQWFTIPDWVVGAAVIGLVPYYTKFLSRADSHVLNTAALTLVPLLYAGYRVVDGLDATWPWRQVRRLRPLSVITVVAIVVLAPVRIGDAARTVPTRWKETARATSPLSRVGYEDVALDDEAITNLERVLDAYLGDDGRLFDFTNSPALFGYLLEHDLASRYFHVSMAIREPDQRDLIAELQRDRPEIIVYASTGMGLPEWDGIPNSVRHYLVSDYILENYEPFVTVAGYTLLRRADVAPIPLSQILPDDAVALTDELYFRTTDCQWGFAPEFLDLEPAKDGRTEAIPARVGAEDVSVTGWSFDADTGTPVGEVLVVVDNRVVSRVPTGADRPDLVLALDQRGVRSAGFAATAHLPEGAAASTPPRFYIEAGEGYIAELPGSGYGQGVVPFVMDGGAPLLVVDRPAHLWGNVEAVERVGDRYRVPLPADAKDYDWLEIETAEPLGEDEVVITDDNGSLAHTISLETLPGGPTRVMVGGCPQWHGYSDELWISTKHGAEITGVRLIKGSQ